MSTLSRFTAGSLLIIMFVLSACQTATPTAAPTAVPTSTSTPTPEPTFQWGAFARASSEWSNDDASASRATGPKTISSCEDSGAAWASLANNTVEWLDVYFKQGIQPSELNIYSNYNPDGITKVELIDSLGDRHEVFTGSFDPEDCPGVLTIEPEAGDYTAVGVRIWVDQTEIEDWVEIDAVQVAGIPVGDALTAMPLLPTPTFAPAAPLGERSYSDRPDDFDGLYQFHVIYALFKDQDDRGRDLDGSIGRSIALANRWFREQAGGSTLRVDTYEGELDVTFIQFDKTAVEAREEYRAVFEEDREIYPRILIEDYYMDWIDAELGRRHVVAPGKYYIVYLEASHPHACGYSQLANHLGVFFLGTDDCGYARLGVDAFAWENEFVVLHEVLHGIGFVDDCATHSIEDNVNHVDDSPKDLMYPYVGRGETAVLDVGNDDYFNHSIPGCNDLADSVFLEPLPDRPVAPDWPNIYRLP